MNKKTISWKARNYQYREKTVDWYYILFFSFATLIGGSYYFFHDLIFAALLLTIFLVIIVISRKRPLAKKQEIGEDYFKIDKEKISFSEIDSYFIDTTHHKILLATHHKYKPLYQIPFEPNQNMSRIDEFLSKKIKKDKKLKIPFLEITLLKILGF